MCLFEKLKSAVILYGFSFYFFHKNYISKEIFENINYIYRYDDLIRKRSGEYEEKIVYTKDGFLVWLVSCDDIKVFKPNPHQELFMMITTK